MSLVPAKCPECGGNINIDPSKKLGVCEYCKEPFVVQEAIQNFNTTYHITNNNEIKAEVVNLYENKEADYVIEAGVLVKYRGANTNVEIPKGVYEIGSHCFYNQNWLKEIVIPEGVKVLQDQAFFNCSRLEKVVLPSTIESVHTGAFEGCNGIRKVITPNTVDVGIYMDAFPDLYKTEIEERNEKRKKEEYERSKKKREEYIDEMKALACGAVPKEFGAGYEVVTLDQVYKHCISIKQLSSKRLNNLLGFISGGYNPISPEAIIKEGENVGTILYHREKGGWNGYNFLGLYGHFFAYEEFSVSPGWENRESYLGYFKECFTNQTGAIQYIQQKQQEFLVNCKKRKLCPYCGKTVGLFGDHNNEHCDRKHFKQYWVIDKMLK